MSSHEVFLPRYQLGPRETNNQPMIWGEDAAEIVINDAMSMAINDGKIPHEILIGCELLDYLGGLSATSIRGQWIDPRCTTGTRRVEFSWVKDTRDESNEKGGIKLVLNDSKTYVWMINHDNASDYNQRLDAWKGRWPD